MASAILLAIVLQASYYQGSNMTEFYGVLPAAGSLYLAACYLRKPNGVLVLWLGVMFAAGALLKPTDIGTQTACIVAVCIHEGISHKYRRMIGRVILFLLPSFLILTLIVIYWAHKGALVDLWQATVVFNLLYVSGGFSASGVCMQRYEGSPLIHP